MSDPRERLGEPLPAEFDRLRAPSPAYAARKIAVYLCTREHLVPVPFAAEAETPEVWECRCGQPATLVREETPGSARETPAARQEAPAAEATETT